MPDFICSGFNIFVKMRYNPRVAFQGIRDGKARSFRLNQDINIKVNRNRVGGAVSWQDRQFAEVYIQQSCSICA
jgi:hypothetical protein